MCVGWVGWCLLGRLVFSVCVCLTVSGHAGSQAFLQATVLAAVPARSVDLTVFLPRTRVRGVALLTPPEETLRPEAKHSSYPSETMLTGSFFRTRTKVLKGSDYLKFTFWMFLFFHLGLYCFQKQSKHLKKSSSVFLTIS